MGSFKYIVWILIFYIVNIFISCSDESKSSVVDPNKSVNSCLDCHTNYDVLREIASPDTAVETGGCGGDAPHYEPYDRVYLGGDGFSDFVNSSHGPDKVACTECHNGVDGTSDKTEAHSGDFIRHPSDRPAESCYCHSNEVERAHNSLHAQGWGQKKRVALRYGVESFDMLPDDVQHGYEKNCGKCHGACGDCHVNRPKAGGGGLYEGHKFNKTPDMRDNCVACHVSRGGHAFFGVGTGTQPDVHLTSENYNCMSCHSTHEVHGDGEVYEQRYTMALLPSCDDCHSGISTINSYHITHINDFNCQTCHSQNYNNCGSCHVGGDGARVVSHQNFKIGMNPIPEIKPYKFATLRLSPHAPDSWEMFGTPELANFNVEPTYKYTTPHNILRWTTRTEVESGKSCSDNCHIILEGDTYRNRNLYLFSSDLLENWVLEANQGVIVDGKLPAGWGTP